MVGGGGVGGWEGGVGGGGGGGGHNLPPYYDFLRLSVIFLIKFLNEECKKYTILRLIPS